MTAMPDPTDPPGPIPDEMDPEYLLRQQFVAQAHTTLSTLVDALGRGHNPVRTLYLIETFAASIKAHIAEVDIEEEPPGVNIGMGGNVIYAGAGGAVPIGARQHRGVPFAPGLAHGRQAEEIRQIMGLLEGTLGGLTRGTVERDRTSMIRNLTEAIKNAQDIEDKTLEDQLRDELRALLEGHNVDGDDIIDGEFTPADPNDPAPPEDLHVVP